MMSDRWERTAEIYQAAAELPEAARPAFLREACGEDSQLRAEVESLFAHANAEVLIDRPVWEAAAGVLDDNSGVVPGTIVGPFRIDAFIGAGGMGDVYRARDTTLQRDVALKVLPLAFVRDADRLARFSREAQVLAALNHPHIAAIYGFERSAAGTDPPIHALVLELVEGPTLAERIARGPLPLDEALPIARQIVAAIEAAHEQGIVHRDLKPANIKLRPDGTVKVLDFGLAKALDPATASTTTTPAPAATITSPAQMTAVGMVLGTAAYMSPEQARGRPADKRSDIWAFGCVIYEMLTGRRAFPGDEMAEVLASILAREPDWTVLPRDLPPSLVVVLKHCLQKNRAQRVGDAQTIRLALNGAFEVDTHEDARARRQSWRRRLPLIAATLTGAALAIAFGASRFWTVPTALPIVRFDDDLPAGRALRSTGRSLMAVSPDGRHFVYNTEAGISLRSMDALGSRVIAGTEGRDVGRQQAISGPFFSADGESIGYFEGGYLKRISTRGGTAIPICPATPGYGATWTTDDTILFGQAQGIMRVPAGGGTAELVIAARDGEVVYGPQLLPDGDSVLFTVTTAAGSGRWDEARIVVQSMASGNRTVVLEPGSDARYVASGHLVYSAGGALLAVPFDPGSLVPRGRPVSVVDAIVTARDQAAQTPAANYGVSDTGTLVYLTGARLEPPAPRGTLVWVDRRGREELIANAPVRAYDSPRLSPNGKQIALVIREEQPDVWIWDVVRGNLSKFTSGGKANWLPVWEPPTGRRLFWASNRGNGNANLYWQNADRTGAVHRLTDSRNSQRPTSFTQDGSLLLFAEAATGSSQADLNADLKMLAMSGDPAPKTLVPTPASEISPELSPDDRWLAYQSNETGQDEIYVVPFPVVVGAERKQVSLQGGREPLWSQNRREIFFLAPDGALMAAPVSVGPRGEFEAGVPVQVIAPGPYFLQAAFHRGRTYDASSDGSRFLRIKVDQVTGPDARPRQFVVVQGWFEELKRLVPTR